MYMYVCVYLCMISQICKTVRNTPASENYDQNSRKFGKLYIYRSLQSGRSHSYSQKCLCLKKLEVLQTID